LAKVKRHGMPPGTEHVRDVENKAAMAGTAALEAKANLLNN
jgi:hypothetical protein